ncbi:retron St85 family effector protein [Bradyrhizobium symbiodeficiens]|uniref:retron St85 family effector protein n=1 Tax=Bradyrhizobium symbiodeficiens TaxID=1404367 RepID=UPI0030CE3611
MSLPYATDLDADKIHVQAPSDIVFLCGGQRSKISDPVPLSLRDAFLKIIDNPVLRHRDLVQAEDVTDNFLFFAKYDDILEFETDFAQIVELIILFCESEGSLAELGAFAMISEIAARLFVVVREKHWQIPSFIKLGPLRLIENKYGRESIYVIEDAEVGLRGDSAEHVDKETLKSLLLNPLTLRLERPREPSTFNPDRSGHVIKLIVGLVQEYGALRLAEISEVLNILNVPRATAEINRYLFCAKAAGWVKEISKGSNDYFVAVATKLDAATLHAKDSAEVKNKGRRRLLIRNHWQANDALRYNAITQVGRGSYR